MVAIAWRAELIAFLRSFQTPYVAVDLRDSEGEPVRLAGRIDVFPLDDSSYLPSPLPLLRSMPFSPEGPILVDGDQLPLRCQLRIHVPGFGVDFLTVDLERDDSQRLDLGPPVTVTGRVVSVAGAPMKGARVFALSGHPRGVVLATAVCGDDGGYALPDLSRRVGFLLLRILHEGYVMVEREHWFDAASYESESKTDFQLVPIPPLRGRVSSPMGSLPTGLQVCVERHAGVVAPVADDGSFEVHHLKAGVLYRLLVHGLAAGTTHRPVRGEPGDDGVRIVLEPAVTLSGRLLGGRGLRPDGVEVWHDCATRGQQVTTTDDYGDFELPEVPAGGVTLRIVVPARYKGGTATAITHDVDPAALRGDDVLAIQL